MLPSQWICKALFRIDPTLRLAWRGRKRKDDNDINAGSFCLTQLLPAQIVGPLHDPNIFSELWDVTPRMVNGECKMVAIDRGPIFNKNGGTIRDWDYITQKPIFIIDLESFGFDKYRVLNGEFLTYLPRWKTSAKKRLKDSMEQKYKDHKSELRDLSGEAGEFLWRQANKTGATGPIVPWEFAKKDVKDFYEKKQHRKLESAYSLKDKL